MVECIDFSQWVGANFVKDDYIIMKMDMMLKMTQTEMKTSPTTEKQETVTFESLRNNGKKT